MEIGGVFGSMRQILDLLSTPGFLGNKLAGRTLKHMLCGRTIDNLPHTSGIETLPMPSSFRKCGEKLETFNQSVIFGNKTPGKQGVIISVWSEFRPFPRTSEFTPQIDPFSSDPKGSFNKKTRFPVGKRVFGRTVNVLGSYSSSLSLASSASSVSTSWLSSSSREAMSSLMAPLAGAFLSSIGAPRSSSSSSA